MAHSYISCHIHYVFSTRNRHPLIHPTFKERLWEYMGGIARQHSMKALAIGGTSNHVHLLVSLPSTSSLSKAIQRIKGGSSLWVHTTFPQHSAFAWQEGYGAFSVGISRIDETIAYINNQEMHHRIKTFEEEYLAFLDAHKVVYDERYVWA